MSEIKLSIITPVYNGRRFIEPCIKNVIDQDCREAEHIIIDGSSTDGTKEIIKHYAEFFPHIRWASEKDNGQSEAMNKGISLAKGEIISFLNVDDYYEPGVFKRILAIFSTLPEPSLLVGNCNIWNKLGQLEGVCKPRRLRLEDLLLGYEINPHPVNPTAYFYHKSLHNLIGGYDVNIAIAMDQDFIFRAVEAAHVEYKDETWGNFRLIDGTKTYEDIKKGTIYKRDKLIINKYRRKFPLLKRCYFLFQYYFIRLLRIIAKKLRRCVYYLKNGKEISAMLKRKINKLLGP